MSNEAAAYIEAPSFIDALGIIPLAGIILGRFRLGLAWPTLMGASFLWSVGVGLCFFGVLGSDAPHAKRAHATRALFLSLLAFFFPLFATFLHA